MVIRDRASGKRLKTGRTRSGFETVNSEIEMINASPRKKNKKQKQQKKITEFSWSAQAVPAGQSSASPRTSRSPRSLVYRDSMSLEGQDRQPTINEVIDYNRWQQKYDFVAASYYLGLYSAVDGLCTIGEDCVALHDEHGWTDVETKTPGLADEDIFWDPESEEEIYTYFNNSNMTRQEKAELLEHWYASQAIKSRRMPQDPRTYNTWVTKAIHEQAFKEQDVVIDSIEQDLAPLLVPRKSSLKRKRESDSEVPGTQGAYRGTRSRSRRVQFSEAAES